MGVAPNGMAIVVLTSEGRSRRPASTGSRRGPPHRIPPVTLLITLLITLAAWAAGCSTPDGREAEVEGVLKQADSLVASWVDAGSLAGAVLLVSRDGVPALEKAYGWARLKEYGEGQYGAWRPEGDGADTLRSLPESTPMTTSTVFDLASVTKVMATTMAVMMLVDRGALQLDAPVAEYLPDFRGGGKDGITLRHLLTHRAGLAQWQPVYYHASDAGEAYDYIRDLPLAWGVGEGRHYSDLGFMLLGRVVEQASGEQLDDFLEGSLYGPMGLVSTEFRRATSGGGADATARYAATSHGNPFEYRMVHDPTFGYLYNGSLSSSLKCNTQGVHSFFHNTPWGLGSRVVYEVCC